MALNGTYAFIGQVSGVPAAEGAGVWTTTFSGNLECVLQQGKKVPGGDEGVLVKSIQSISLRNGYLTALITLKGAGVSGANSTMLFGRGVGGGISLIRTGDPLTVDGKMAKIKKLTVFTPPKLSPGHGRFHANLRTVASAVLDDKRSVLLSVVNAGTVTPLLATDGAANNVFAGATWKGFGLPTVGHTGGSFAAMATLNRGGDVTASNDTAIVVSSNGVAFDDLAIEGGSAPGAGSATFAGFSDPLSNSAGRYAFLGTIKGGGVSGVNRTGIWYGSTSANLGLLARTGGIAPDAAGFTTDAVFTGFSNLALPGGSTGAPLFLAAVKGPGINGKNKVGLWGVDSDGFLRQLLRNGDNLGGSVVKNFTLLNSGAGAFNVSRTFNNAGGVLAVVNFSDRTQALAYIGLP